MMWSNSYPEFKMRLKFQNRKIMIGKRILRFFSAKKNSLLILDQKTHIFLKIQDMLLTIRHIIYTRGALPPFLPDRSFTVHAIGLFCSNKQQDGNCMMNICTT